jgi:hypothetical protein
MLRAVSTANVKIGPALPRQESAHNEQGA